MDLMPDITLGGRNEKDTKIGSCDGAGYLLLYYSIKGKRTVNLSAISRKLLRSGFEKIRQVPGRLVVLRKEKRIIAIDSKGRIRAIVSPVTRGTEREVVKSVDRFLARLPKELGVKDVKIEPVSCLSSDAFLEIIPGLIR
jgi:hypothetical protein